MTDLALEEVASTDEGVEVSVRGEIDVASASQLRDFLDRLLDAGSSRIVLDCRKLEFLDSSGIGVLVAARNRLGDAGDLILDSPQPQVRKVLDITGVSSRLSVVP